MNKLSKQLHGKIDKYGNIYYCNDSNQVSILLKNSKKIVDTFGKIIEKDGKNVFIKSEKSTYMWGIRLGKEPHWSIGAEILKIIDEIIYTVDKKEIHTFVKNSLTSEQKRECEQSKSHDNCEHKFYIPLKFWKITDIQ